MNTQEANSNPSFFKKITYTDGIYPTLEASVIQNPNRIFAVPLVGISIKSFLLFPVLIELLLLYIWFLFVVMLINSFVVLATGKYWQHAYRFALGMLKLNVKIGFYIYGLTDKYPGFGFDIDDKFNLDIIMPERSKRLYAIPILGGVIRIILLIPYFVFFSIISNAALIGVYLLAWAIVLFKGRYPEGIFELARDSTRVTISVAAYFAGLSDKYPSFYISMAHDKIKLILIAASILLTAWNYSSS